MAGCAIAASSTTAPSPACGASIATAASDHRHRLWSLVMLELWFRQFVDVGRRLAVPARTLSRQASGAGEAA